MADDKLSEILRPYSLFKRLYWVSIILYIHVKSTTLRGKKTKGSRCQLSRKLHKLLYLHIRKNLVCAISLKICRILYSYCFDIANFKGCKKYLVFKPEISGVPCCFFFLFLNIYVGYLVWGTLYDSFIDHPMAYLLFSYLYFSIKL